MAKKWLDSIEKQKRSNVCDRRTDGQTDRVNDKKNNKTPKLGAEINNLVCLFVSMHPLQCMTCFCDRNGIRLINYVALARSNTR